MIKIKYFKELKKYKKNEIENFSQELLLKTIEEGYLKKNEKGYFYFDCVGIIYIKNHLIVVFPKIIQEIYVENEEKREKYLKFTVDLLKMEQKKLVDNILKIEGSPDSNILSNNKIPLMDFFFRDYEEYGVYENEKEDHTINGNGEINWELTVEVEAAFLSRGRPVYLNLHTRADEVDGNNYIMELHKFILDKCVREAGELSIQKLLGILDIPSTYFHVSEDRLGNPEYQLQMIEKEMRVQFNERKVRLLKAMKIYIYNRSIDVESGISLWGTKQFWRIWENACAWVFENEYKEGSLYYNRFKRDTKGKWIEREQESKAMEPDIVTLKGNILYIADAKYYNEKTIHEDLGVQDTAKQFMYHRTLEGMEPEGGKIVNLFLVSGEKENYISKVTMGIFGSMKIHALSLGGIEMLEMYRRGIKKDIGTLLNMIPEGEVMDG